MITQRSKFTSIKSKTKKILQLSPGTNKSRRVGTDLSNSRQVGTELMGLRIIPTQASLKKICYIIAEAWLELIMNNKIIINHHSIPMPLKSRL
jgi:hypothetical protein